MRHAFRFEWAGGVALAGVLLLAAAAAGADSAPRYRLAHQVSLPGDEGWDYLTLEPEGHRLFIAHGTHVLVVDTGTLAVAGRIADTPGVHGIALAPELNRGYVSAGRAGLVVVFDLKTLARLKEIKTTGENPDAIVYDAATRHVFTFNGRALGSAPIGAGVDAAAYDPGSGLAFASCGEGNLTVVRTGASGAAQVVQSVPTRRGARTMALDTRTHRVYLVSADFGPPPPASPEQPHPRPAIQPGTFRLLVLEPEQQPAASPRGERGP